VPAFAFAEAAAPRWPQAAWDPFRSARCGATRRPLTCPFEALAHGGNSARPESARGARRWWPAHAAARLRFL